MTGTLAIPPCPRADFFFFVLIDYGMRGHVIIHDAHVRYSHMTLVRNYAATHLKELIENQTGIVSSVAILRNEFFRFAKSIRGEQLGYNIIL